MEQVTKRFFTAKDKFTVASHTQMLEKKLFKKVLRKTSRIELPTNALCTRGLEHRVAAPDSQVCSHLLLPKGLALMRPHQAKWLPGSFWPGEGLLTGRSNPPLLRTNLLILSHKYTGLHGNNERGKILFTKESQDSKSLLRWISQPSQQNNDSTVDYNH